MDQILKEREEELASKNNFEDVMPEGTHGPFSLTEDSKQYFMEGKKPQQKSEESSKTSLNANESDRKSVACKANKDAKKVQFKSDKPSEAEKTVMPNDSDVKPTNSKTNEESSDIAMKTRKTKTGTIPKTKKKIRPELPLLSSSSSDEKDVP